LDLALAKSGRSYSLTVADDNLPQKRRSAIMEKSSQPYIMIMGTNPKLETQHRAIYFPIYLGIGSGYRLFLARKDLQDRLRAVRNLKDLQNFSIVQGMHWSDVAILRNAGLEIQEVARKSLLWKMTEIGRYDLFPRGMFEIFEEHANYKKQLPNLIVDDHLLITYPFAIYYFVNKDNDELAAAIEAGLRAAYHGGELQDLLFKTIGPNVKKALKEIKNRVRIDLPAHNISPQTLEVIKKYPFDFSRIEN
ncbi:MAG: hypothetical protein HN732_09390, partial [Rhodospirillaceae bacterium]|nr:hypothetical protein [Rhodospirillaceae bacterium]